MYACSINSHRDSTEQIAVIILFMNEETKGQIKKNCIASYIAEDKTEFGKKLAIPFVVLLWFYPQKKKNILCKNQVLCSWLYFMEREFYPRSLKQNWGSYSILFSRAVLSPAHKTASV